MSIILAEGSIAHSRNSVKLLSKLGPCFFKEDFTYLFIYLESVGAGEGT